MCTWRTGPCNSIPESASPVVVAPSGSPIETEGSPAASSHHDDAISQSDDIAEGASPSDGILLGFFKPVGSAASPAGPASVSEEEMDKRSLRDWSLISMGCAEPRWRCFSFEIAEATMSPSKSLRAN